MTATTTGQVNKKIKILDLERSVEKDEMSKCCHCLWFHFHLWFCFEIKIKTGKNGLFECQPQVTVIVMIVAEGGKGATKTIKAHLSLRKVCQGSREM